MLNACLSTSCLSKQVSSWTKATKLGEFFLGILSNTNFACSPKSGLQDTWRRQGSFKEPHKVPYSLEVESMAVVRGVLDRHRLSSSSRDTLSPNLLYAQVTRGVLWEWPIRRDSTPPGLLLFTNNFSSSRWELDMPTPSLTQTLLRSWTSDCNKQGFFHFLDSQKKSIEKNMSCSGSAMPPQFIELQCMNKNTTSKSHIIIKSHPRLVK